VSVIHRHRIGLVLVLVAGLVLAPLQTAVPQDNKISLIRDAEIESILRRVTAPILQAAGLGANGINMYIVNDDRLNAFVAGGQNLFLNTGLLMRASDPSQLLGVIAHETGHISGGHLSRIPTAQSRAAVEMVLATVLGAAAAVAGAPDVGAAIMSGGASYAQGNLMAFSRTQEQAADQAALSFLQQAGISARGMLEIFKKLENENALVVSGMNPYVRSHPLTRDRIAFVENYVRSESIEGSGVPEEWVQAQARMVAKLEAFLQEPQQVLQRYQDDASITGRYARAIAFYRLPDMGRALQEVDALIAENPDDPYFHELKGQMLFENGRVAEAVPPYREAVRLRPDSALLRLGLGQALIETNEPESNQEAIAHLEEAIKFEPRNAGAWRLLGIARGRAGQEGVSALAFAEYALLLGKKEDARLYARRAEGNIDPSDPAWLRLQDILRVIDEG
jgi:predicted Zn-dependent protease